MREPVGLIVKRVLVVGGGLALAALVYSANNIETPHTPEQAGYNAGTFGMYALCVWIIMRGLGIRLFKSAPVILACLLAGCGGTPTSPGATPVLSSADLAFCVTETNRLRATIGRSALAQSAALESFAAAATEHDHKSGGAHDYFRANASGNVAENQVNRWSGTSGRTVMANAIQAFWSEGPGGPHWENIAGNYTHLGCGAYQSGSSITFVQEFRR